MSVTKPMHKPIPKAISNFTLDKFMDRYEPWTKEKAWKLYDFFIPSVSYIVDIHDENQGVDAIIMSFCCDALKLMQDNDFAYWGSMSDRQNSDLCKAIDTLIDIVNRELE